MLLQEYPNAALYLVPSYSVWINGWRSGARWNHFEAESTESLPSLKKLTRKMLRYISISKTDNVFKWVLAEILDDKSS